MPRRKAILKAFGTVSMNRSLLTFLDAIQEELPFQRCGVVRYCAPVSSWSCSKSLGHLPISLVSRCNASCGGSENDAEKLLPCLRG